MTLGAAAQQEGNTPPADPLREVAVLDRALQQSTPGASTLAGLERELTTLYLHLVPSLVEVRTQYAGTDATREVSTAGVVVSAEGLVIAPIFFSKQDESQGGVSAESELEVRRVDGVRFTGRVIARDERYGLALIRVEGLRGMQPQVFPGEWMAEGSPVIALGNAYGFEASMSLGLLTGKARFAGSARRLLQITNPVNPGDGGGLLANSRGEVIGILLTALPELADSGIEIGIERQFQELHRGLSDSDRIRALRAEGIGFAVPIEIVTSLFPEQLGSLLRRKRMLGVEVSSRLVVMEDPLGPARRWAVEIQSVLPSSAAEVAGLIAGDLVLELNGQPLATVEDLGRAMFQAPERAAMLVLRNGEVIRTEVDFGSWLKPLPEFGLQPEPESEPKKNGE